MSMRHATDGVRFPKQRRTTATFKQSLPDINAPGDPEFVGRFSWEHPTTKKTYFFSVKLIQKSTGEVYGITQARWAHEIAAIKEGMSQAVKALGTKQDEANRLLDSGFWIDPTDTGLSFSPTTPSQSAGSSPPPPAVVAQTQKIAKRILEGMQDVKEETSYRDSKYVSTQPLSENWDSTMKDPITKDELDKFFTRPLIGIFNGNSNCFLNTMFQAGVLTDRPLMEAILNYDHTHTQTPDDPVGIIKLYLYNYIKLANSGRRGIKFSNLWRLRTALNKIKVELRKKDAEEYSRDSHDAGEVYLLLREYFVSKKLLTAQELQLTEQRFWELPSGMKVAEKAVVDTQTGQNFEPLVQSGQDLYSQSITTLPSVFQIHLPLPDDTSSSAKPTFQKLIHAWFTHDISDTEKEETTPQAVRLPDGTLDLVPCNRLREAKRLSACPEKLLCSVNYTANTSGAVANPIEISLKDVSLPTGVCGDIPPYQPYALSSIMVHPGTGRESGHWYGYRRLFDGTWGKMDDEKVAHNVKPVDIISDLEKNNFVLVYTRRDLMHPLSAKNDETSEQSKTSALTNTREQLRNWFTGPKS